MSDAEVSAYLNDLVVCARHLLPGMSAPQLSAVVPAIVWAEAESKRLSAPKEMPAEPAPKE